MQEFFVGSIGLVFGLVWLTVVIFLISLAIRIVKAVEKIAEVLEKNSTRS